MEIIIISPSDLETLIKTSIRTAFAERSSNSKQSSNEFLSMDEAVKFLKIPKASIYQLTSKREIPFVKRSRRIFFKKSDLETWLEGGRKQTREEIEAEALREMSKSGKRKW